MAWEEVFGNGLGLLDLPTDTNASTVIIQHDSTLGAVERVQGVKGRLLWRQDFGARISQIIKFDSRCNEGLIHRKDGSTLKPLCLHGTVAMILSDANRQLQLRVTDIVTGDAVMSMTFGPEVKDIDFIVGDSHRIAIVYENVEKRRTELRLVEFFMEAEAVDRRVLMERRFASKSSLLPLNLKVYDETYTTNLPSVDAVAFTKTRELVSPQTLIIASLKDQRLYATPHRLLSARRPATPADKSGQEQYDLPRPEVDGDVPVYVPHLEFLPFDFIPEEVLSPNAPLRMWCEPTAHESTTGIHFGVSSQPLLYQPAKAWDMLAEGFSKTSTIASLAILLGAFLMTLRSLGHKQKGTQFAAP